MISPNLLTKYRKTFLKIRSLQNKHRLYFFNLIDAQPEINVGDLTEKSGFDQALTSQFIAILRKAGFVKTRRDGRTIFYSTHKSEVCKLITLATSILSSKKVEFDAMTSANLLSTNYNAIMRIHNILKILLNKNRLYILDYVLENPNKSIKQITEELCMKRGMVSLSLKMFCNIQFMIYEEHHTIMQFKINKPFFEKFNEAIEEYL
jgi:DNA-binding MarR family transcriptional regulator